MQIGNIQSVDIDSQMRRAYLDYAMSVIVARALPDARDGLKPVHRRVLYAMYDMGIRANTPYKKSARIVGEVLGKYHPHGDQAVYDSMARMAQDFSLRYLMVDGQGNFGSIDGDAPAAMRYTEARLSHLAEEMLVDIEKETIDWGDNFDGSLKEPLVLPSRLPNLLLNGTSGIAVGMATNIPPHNLRELASAIVYLIDRPAILAVVAAEGGQAATTLQTQFGLSAEQARKLTRVLLKTKQEDQLAELSDEESEAADASLEELLVFVQGPDFPTGGTIVGTEGIATAYGTGRGRVVVRGVASVETGETRPRIIITEIPYQVNKTSLIEKIAELAREERIPFISDLRDESDRNGMRIVIELKRGAQPRKVLNQLYKHTTLQSTFGVQLLALVNNEPRLLSLRRALQIYIQHRQDVIRRRTEFELAKALARAHILDGLLIAVANIDAVIRLIRESDSADLARQNLVARFDLSDLQAQAILELQLRRLAALERLKLEQEYQDVRARIAYLEDLLNSVEKILALIKADLLELAQKYGDNRRSQIAREATEALNDEDLVADTACLLSITERGYIKRMSIETFKAQQRGGKGVIGQNLREEDVVEFLFSARAHDTVLFFSDKGKVYSTRAFDIPEAKRTDRGTMLPNVIAIESGERITACLPISEFRAADYCTMVTRAGKIKRVSLSEFESVRATGLIAIGLEDGDVLGWAKVSGANHDLVLVTEQGQALRFNSSEVRPTGRPAMGVRAINLADGDQLCGFELHDPDGDLLVVTAKGYGKRTAFNEYPVKGRATGGVQTINKNSLAATGHIVAVKSVQADDQVTIMSVNGQVLRTAVAQISRYGRATSGTRLMGMREGDQVATVACIRAADLELSAEAANEGTPAELSEVEV